MVHNGLNVTQGRYFLKISCKSYLTKVLQSHDWMESSKKTTATPIKYNKKCINDLHDIKCPEILEDQLVLENSMDFKYQQGIGKLLFSAVTCRPEIMYAVIKLSQFPTKPAEIHYQSIKQIFRYLQDTIEFGIHYWRPEPRENCPNLPFSRLAADNHEILTIHQKNITEPYDYVDSDWAGDVNTRKFVTCLAIMLSGGPVAYKSKSQPTIAHNTTEVEFTAATECSKTAFYIRLILDELGLYQDSATITYEDNAATIEMENTQQKTRQTRHVDIKYFALLQWCETDQIILSAIFTPDTAVDVITKPLATTLFNRHRNTLLGNRPPHDVTYSIPSTH